MLSKNLFFLYIDKCSSIIMQKMHTHTHTHTHAHTCRSSTTVTCLSVSAFSATEVSKFVLTTSLCFLSNRGFKICAYNHISALTLPEHIPVLLRQLHCIPSSNFNLLLKTAACSHSHCSKSVECVSLQTVLPSFLLSDSGFKVCVCNRISALTLLEHIPCCSGNCILSSGLTTNSLKQELVHTLTTINLWSVHIPLLFRQLHSVFRFNH